MMIGGIILFGIIVVLIVVTASEKAESVSKFIEK
ncbi:hypothetical protein J2Z65_001818 [Paenibacillus aceris]|uniref:Flagellin Flp1-like domain-containing protein n=1 Tax=Paenibacillus aceris TaxID=869555 RepID=A0ABS4HXF2_9BACL|nr:hypothetical protein [Paenibacillus aceris]